MPDRGKPPSQRKPIDPMPIPPPEIERLRDAAKVIDPGQTYALEMPDGTVFRAKGSDLLREARLMVALADADAAGDEPAMRRAIEALENIDPDA